MTSLSTKNIFPLFQQNKVWYGVSALNSAKWFQIPDHYPLTGSVSKVENGKNFVKVPGICWYTNIDNEQRHEELLFLTNYDRALYPKFDNYNAIEVSRIAEIPCDYDGVMGVPISFVSRYNPEQFEILGITEDNKNNPYCTKIYTPADSDRYSSLNGRAVLKLPDGNLKKQFPRILIRRK